MPVQLLHGKTQRTPGAVLSDGWHEPCQTFSSVFPKEVMMQSQAELKRVLVLVGPDGVSPENVGDSVLLGRATALAKATGCRLELCHVVHDASLGQWLFTRDAEVLRARDTLVAREATRLAEVAELIAAEGVNVDHDVRWDQPRSDALLRKIHETQPVLVMKRSREHRYVMGLLTNTDWDLIRRSPAHLWFVTEDRADLERLVTAVGTMADDDTIISAADYDVFRVAGAIAEAFGADHYPVHAYQVPGALDTYSSYLPDLGDRVRMPPGTTLEDARRDVAQEHGEAIRGFAESFELDPGRIRLAAGHPSDVLPAMASSLAADLIVMGARNLGRWERAFATVTAEPVLADAPCDVIFVKERVGVEVPEAEEAPVTGVPVVDLEQAVTDPARTFGSPEAVVETTTLSVALRERILQAWEGDVRAQMVEEDEGGPVRVTAADCLEAIRAARSALNDAASAALESGDPIAREALG